MLMSKIFDGYGQKGGVPEACGKPASRQSHRNGQEGG